MMSRAEDDFLLLFGAYLVLVCLRELRYDLAFHLDEEISVRSEYFCLSSCWISPVSDWGCVYSE